MSPSASRRHPSPRGVSRPGARAPARRSFPAGVLAAALLCAAVLGGCADDDPAPGRVSPDPADMAMVAADLSLVAGLGLQQYTAAGLVLPVVMSPAPGRAAAVDTLLRELVDCPLVLHHRDAGPSFYEFRYGAGCVSDFDGRPTAGSILFTVNTAAPFAPYEVFSDFDEFARDGRQVTGLLEIRGTPVGRLTLEASSLDISGRRAGGFLSADLDVTPVEDPCIVSDPLCGGWRVPEGAGSETTSLFVYNITVQDTLVISGCHPYPVRGVIAVTSGGTYPALIDFGDGTCDDTATMTVEGRTQTITLGYGS